MSSANRKEHRVSFQPIPLSKGHRHQSSDSGISEVSSTQDFFDLEMKYKKLLEDFAQHKSESKARCSALQNTIDVLESDKLALDREKRNLREENNLLRDDLRKAQRNSPPRDSTKMSGALPSHPPSPKEHKESKESKESKLRRSESKHRRGESKVRKTTEEKELAKRVKEDKERLGRRFDHKDDKSVSSGGSSSRSKQSSYIEPMGPSAPRPAANIEPPRTHNRRSESTSYSIRPSVITTTTVTEPSYGNLPRTPGYADHESPFDYDGAYAHAQYVPEDANYYAPPLSSEPSRGRSRR
ncbi:hypothetical protein CORC01_14165 [Colletotrichum orchidophilum]|uniref:Uncharacterized protein n=1 Tax=Colletotrichum orchidophilum TaxID=1209926 RepID=A0A1G4AN41_9PEZI|nr:uncharacterized protein CORC01_14165 [Colletotrichum orchidophilum]OHE90541.1 hypothetical protein CORC01_14165 [Colletotrichum orchidophilum]